MVVRSSFKITSNLVRVFLVAMLLLILPILAQTVINHIGSTFNIMLIPICLFLAYMIIAAIRSIKKVYNQITITKEGLEVQRYMGLGGKRYYPWSELDEYNFNNETSARGPNYHSFSVEKKGKTILRFDDITYRNFKQMQVAVQNHMDGRKRETHL